MKRFLALPAVAALVLACTAPMASADVPGPLTLPGQVGAATAYTTPNGTAVWTYYVYAGAADEYHYARVAVPANINTTIPTPTVLAVHGATATEDQFFTYSTAVSGGNAVLNSWLDRGWPVIATREGSTVNLNANGVKVGSNGKWGNQASAVGMADAWPWAQSAWTPDPHGLLIYGWSMGGAGALNAAAELQRRSAPVGAVDVIDGATNLRYDYANSSAFAKNMRTAYSLPSTTIAGDAAWVAGVDIPEGGHDPQQMVTNLTPFPLRLSGSVSDATVNTANNSQLLYNTLAATSWSASAELSWWSYGLGHCAKPHFKPIDVNAFFDRALAL